MHATMPSAPPRLPIVEQRLAEVSTSLNSATGGGALCRIDGTGGSAKSLEGHMAALLELRRSLRKDPDDGARAATTLLDRWRSDLAERSERGASAAWLEYLAGGVSELEHLLADDGGPPPAGRTRSGGT